MGRDAWISSKAVEGGFIFALTYWGRNLSFVFLEELKKPKSPFEINWPLVGALNKRHQGREGPSIQDATFFSPDFWNSPPSGWHFFTPIRRQFLSPTKQNLLFHITSYYQCHQQVLRRCRTLCGFKTLKLRVVWSSFERLVISHSRKSGIQQWALKQQSRRKTHPATNQIVKLELSSK